jgi:hypothetical protein
MLRASDNAYATIAIAVAVAAAIGWNCRNPLTKGDHHGNGCLREQTKESVR